MAASDRTHYDVLGIPRDADAGAVRSAWKLHVQAWHPDRFSDELRDEAERHTTRINEAYSVLRDSSRRAAYDCRLAADEADVERAARSRRAPAARTHSIRPATAPVGSPMTAAAPAPSTLAGHASAIGGDAMRIVRRHPRIAAIAACTWLLVFGGSLEMHMVSGPTLPASASARPAQPVSAIVAADAHVDDLEDLAERARAEAAAADAEMQQLLEEDARLAAAEAAAAARAAAKAAKAAPRAAKPAPRAGSSAAPAIPDATGDGRRIVRVMPSSSGR